MDDDSKILLGALVVVALVVCAFVWLTSNGLSGQISEVKTLSAKNAEALARIEAGAGSATGGTGGGAANPSASPEAGLPKGVSKIAGEASCAVGGKPKVFLFTDPYCPACASSEQYVNDFVNSFKTAVDITYRTVVTHSGGLIQKYGDANVTIAHEYFLCVQEQGLDKIQAFKQEFYENLKVRDATQDYVPFTQAQLAGFAETAGADAAKITSCLAGAKARVDADVQDALRFGGGTYSTPTMVLDCLYTGHSGYAANAVCYAYPSLTQCKK
jgi:predicted DsbA family dithiol-disulfide isomerase